MIPVILSKATPAAAIRALHSSSTALCRPLLAPTLSRHPLFGTQPQQQQHRTSTAVPTPGTGRCLGTLARSNPQQAFARCISTSASKPAASSSDNSSSTSSSCNSSNRSNSQQFSPLEPDQPSGEPLFVWVSRAIGLMLGIYGGARIVFWYNGIPFPYSLFPSSSAPASRTRPPEPIDPSLPPVPPMPYTSSRLPSIFLSIAEPLVEFDQRADQFVERKDKAQKAYETLFARKRTGSVPQEEVRAIERTWAAIQSEERTLFQPRLAYLRVLFRTRSLELMQRTQYNAERLVEEGAKNMAAQQQQQQGGGTAASTSVSSSSPALKPSSSSSPSPSASTLRREIDAEMAEYKLLAQKYAHIMAIADKYAMKGSDINMRRMMVAKPEAEKAS